MTIQKQRTLQVKNRTRNVKSQKRVDSTHGKCPRTKRVYAMPFKRRSNFPPSIPYRSAAHWLNETARSSANAWRHNNRRSDKCSTEVAPHCSTTAEGGEGVKTTSFALLVFELATLQKATIMAAQIECVEAAVIGPVGDHARPTSSQLPLCRRAPSRTGTSQYVGQTTWSRWTDQK